MSASPVSAPSGVEQYRLDAALLRGVSALGFLEPRPLQARALPAALAGRDVLGLAQTGTGKTAAFALPILQRLIEAPGPGPRALVLAPTRELATQIDTEFRALARFARVSTLTIYGGVSSRAQIAGLRRRPDVLVACPGRLLDLLQQRELRLDRIETLVIDEADHMFDMGFLPDLRRILAALPARRRNLLFSATMPTAIRGLADQILADPHVVELDRVGPASTIEHALYPVLENSKRDLLEHILGADGFESAIVFTRTKHRARRLAEQLDRAGHRAVALQGNMNQGQRDRAMRGFRERRFDVLVATDIAARGIDVSQVSHVINFDVPNVPEAYTHRIGRTGRSEREGKACTFVTGEDRAMVGAIERMLGAPIPRNRVPGFEADFPEVTSAGRPGRPASRGRSNGRRSSGGSSASLSYGAPRGPRSSRRGRR
jgi:ATP-dependent RNA helicase RhlE